MLLELAKARRRASARSTRRSPRSRREARKDDEAIEWQQKALAKNPNDPSAYERLAERYVEMQKFADAIAAYEKIGPARPAQLQGRSSRSRSSTSRRHRRRR